MTKDSDSTIQRKKDHIDLCLTDEVNFRDKTNGFDKYDFKHYAITEVKKDNIDFTTTFFEKKINYPFLISCMTGGTAEAENINARLATAAHELNIPIGVGSQRLMLENKDYHLSYQIIRRKAPSIPLLGNIGASQLVKMDNFDQIQFIIDLIEADGLIIHLNAAQELLQSKGEPDFTGLLKKLEKLAKKVNVPIIVKEVGAGISKKVAEKLLEAGIIGIDVAGAGGTSWTAVEILRSNEISNSSFWDWGLPTSYCKREVSKLKKKHNFILIGSGGINTPIDMAKAFALGADIAASARMILQVLDKSSVSGVNDTIIGWFEVIKKIMFLTGSNNMNELRNNIILKEKLY